MPIQIFIGHQPHALPQSWGPVTPLRGILAAVLSTVASVREAVGKAGGGGHQGGAALLQVRSQPPKAENQPPQRLSGPTRATPAHVCALARASFVNCLTRPSAAWPGPLSVYSSW